MNFSSTFRKQRWLLRHIPITNRNMMDRQLTTTRKDRRKAKAEWKTKTVTMASAHSNYEQKEENSSYRPLPELFHSSPSISTSKQHQRWHHLQCYMSWSLHTLIISHLSLSLSLRLIKRTRATPAWERQREGGKDSMRQPVRLMQRKKWDSGRKKQKAARGHLAKLFFQELPGVRRL